MEPPTDPLEITEILTEESWTECTKDDFCGTDIEY
jgi:hypothetical protein